MKLAEMFGTKNADNERLLKQQALQMQQDLLDMGCDDVELKFYAATDPFATLKCSFSKSTRRIALRLYRTGVWNNGRFGGTRDDMIDDMARRLHRAEKRIK